MFRFIVFAFMLYAGYGVIREETIPIENSIWYSVQKIKDAGIRFPELVLAQTVHETGIYKSKVFLENRNLFGMKENSRGYCRGTKNGHAYYPHKIHLGPCGWKCLEPSLKDYKEWQDRFVPDTVTTVESYMDILRMRRYAEDPYYKERVLNWYKVLKSIK